MFEGLGIGSRLAYMMLPQKYNFVPIAAALLYGITTPVGVGVGLGVRSTYNPGSTTASIVSGVLDSTSAGILIYTGMVEVGILFASFHTKFDAIWDSSWPMSSCLIKRWPTPPMGNWLMR
jgi:hypothetical protein